MILPDRFFVTGTDTEVGKTVVSACLLASRPGMWGLKPVASGVDGGSAGIGEDEALLAYAGNHVIPEGGVRLRAPLSPHRSAMLEGKELEPHAILAWIQTNAPEHALVEGAGGWEVPITSGFRMSDLAVGLGWPVLVVAADRLGVLNHTLLTVQAIRSRGLEVCGVVLNGAAPGGNLTDLRTLLPGVPVRYLTRLPSLLRPTLAEAGAKLRTRRHVALLIPTFTDDAGVHVFLQHRDAGAPIHPNRIGLFGGHVESGESAEAAMRREAWEELEFSVGDAEFLQHDEEIDVIRDVWSVRVGPEFAGSVTVHEGEAGRFHRLADALTDPRLIPSLRPMLQRLAARG